MAYRQQILLCCHGVPLRSGLARQTSDLKVLGSIPGGIAFWSMGIVFCCGKCIGDRVLLRGVLWELRFVHWGLHFARADSLFVLWGLYFAA